MCTERAIRVKYGAKREKSANFQHNFTNETDEKWARTCRVGQNCLAATMLDRRSVPKTNRAKILLPIETTPRLRGAGH
jgi:hypothetical protein